MVDLQSYRSFSSMTRSDRIEERLQGRFLPRFEQLAGCPEGILLGQQDVTTLWREQLESTVRAISWSIVNGVEMVVVLLDDEDFGKEIKWFARTTFDVDYKHLVMAAEAGTELLAAGRAWETGEVRRFEIDQLGERPVRSTMFCYSFAASAMLPAEFSRCSPWAVLPGIDARIENGDEGRKLVLDAITEPTDPVLLYLKAQLEILRRGGSVQRS